MVIYHFFIYQAGVQFLVRKTLYLDGERLLHIFTYMIHWNGDKRSQPMW